MLLYTNKIDKYVGTDMRFFFVCVRTLVSLYSFFRCRPATDRPTDHVTRSVTIDRFYTFATCCAIQIHKYSQTHARTLITPEC